MNQEYFGDSYDVVKRFICGALVELGFEVYVRPMFTGPEGEWRERFVSFIGARLETADVSSARQEALLIDPDTGVTLGRAKSRDGIAVHIRVQEVLDACKRYAIVIVFDQAFSRNVPRPMVLQKKLAGLPDGCFYYASHASFLFAGKDAELLAKVADKLASMGIPSVRLVRRPAPAEKAADCGPA